MARTFRKDVDAYLDYAVDWSVWLVEGDVIDSVEWLVPDGLSIGGSEQTETAATVWLSGGEVGRRYAVTCRVLTAAGRVDDRTLTIVGVQK